MAAHTNNSVVSSEGAVMQSDQDQRCASVSSSHSKVPARWLIVNADYFGLSPGVNAGIVEKTGTWFLFKTERLGQGRDNAKAFLKQTPALADEIEKAIRAKYLGAPAGSTIVAAKPEWKDEAEEFVAPKAAKETKDKVKAGK